MSVFTAEELSIQIEAYKKALLALSVAKSYSTPTGHTLTREDLPEIRKTLDWLASEKSKIDAAAAGIAPGAVLVSGIPFRGR